MSHLVKAACGRCITVMIAALLTCCGHVGMCQLVAIHSFASLASQEWATNIGGAYPTSTLVQGKDGYLYGTCSRGGNNGTGTIFRMSLNGRCSTLYNFGATTGPFDENADGVDPASGLIQAADGNFYGTCIAGGKFASGTIYRITPGGVLTTLHTFSAQNASGSNADGVAPIAGLIQGKDGNLYGACEWGGAFDSGTIYRISLKGSFTTIHTLSALTPNGVNSDGAEPCAAFVQATDGNLYGTCSGGGANGNGTIFRIAAGGSFATLYTFAPGIGQPLAPLVQAKDSVLYGTASGGGGSGAVFSFTTQGVFTTLTNSTYEGRVVNPIGGLVQADDGNLYGTDQDHNDRHTGAIYRITPAGSLTTLYRFTPLNNDYYGTNSDGADPVASLNHASDGNLYGTCTQGGANGGGTVFRISVKPVLLVHGLWSDPTVWTEMNEQLAMHGFYGDAIDFSKTAATQNSPHGGPTEALIEDQAAAISVEIKKLITDDTGHLNFGLTVDMVCHSMGGLAARYYLENPTLWPGYPSRYSRSCIGKLVTLGTPHWGTDIMLADPVSTITLARASSPVGGLDSSANVDTIDNWSDALSEMFAQWMPPPPSSSPPPKGYPNGWVLAAWPSYQVSHNVYSYRSPISSASINLANLELSLGQFPSNNASAAVKAAVIEFNLPTVGQFQAHLNYYALGLHILGKVLWPANPKVATIGVGERYISKFLNVLNGTLTDTSGAKRYVVAGDSPTFYLLVPGPYNIPSDGVVPEESALGIDPLTGVSLIPNIVTSTGKMLPYFYNHVVFPLNHVELPSDSDVMNQVVVWLTANE